MNRWRETCQVRRDLIPCPRNDNGSRGSRVHEMRNRVRVMCKPGSERGRGGQPPRSTRPIGSSIDRAACANMNQRLAGNAAIATFNQSWMKVTADTPLIFATLCEGNHIKNSSVGFDLEGSFSFLIRGTTFENCSKSVNDKGRDTALLPGAPSPLNPLPIPAGRR